MARKQKTIHYIYKTTCLVTNRYYIGMHSTNNIEDGYMGSGLRLRRSIRKYGIEQHKKEIIKFFDTRNLLIEAEIKLITPEMILDKNCMNMMSGGTGGWVSKEVQLKCSKAGGKASGEKFKNDENYRLLTLNKLKKASEKLIETGVNKRKGRGKGRTHSNETKKLMSDIRSINGVGKGNSQYGTCWITKEDLNKKIKKEEMDKYKEEGWVKGRK